uniref:Uncharacterized protein n=1 Tax=viral metagenome TaxID=1070528 RepID=A0A6C0DK55_9ZZZZ
MNTEYLLKMKHENDYINAYLDQIKGIYKHMKEDSVYFLIDSSLNVNENHIQYNKTIKEIDDLLNQQNEHIQQFILLNKKINRALINMCNHEWCTDSIDIDPDRSKTIEYCKICSCMK